MLCPPATDSVHDDEKEECGASWALNNVDNMEHISYGPADYDKVRDSNNKPNQNAYISHASHVARANSPLDGMITSQMLKQPTPQNYVLALDGLPPPQLMGHDNPVTGRDKATLRKENKLRHRQEAQIRQKETTQWTLL